MHKRRMMTVSINSLLLINARLQVQYTVFHSIIKQVLSMLCCLSTFLSSRHGC